MLCIYSKIRTERVKNERVLNEFILDAEVSYYYERSVLLGHIERGLNFRTNIETIVNVSVRRGRLRKLWLDRDDDTVKNR